MVYITLYTVHLLLILQCITMLVLRMKHLVHNIWITYIIIIFTCYMFIDNLKQ